MATSIMRAQLPLQYSPPKLSTRIFAIFFCCSMEQWFSNDKINGYLQHNNIYITINTSW